MPYKIGEKRWQAYFEFEYAKASLLIRQLNGTNLMSKLRGRFLDVASGFAGCSQAFSDLLPINNGVSLDIRPYKQYFAKKILSEDIGVTIADALRMPFFTNSFDLVLSFSAIEHVPSPKAFLLELSRVLQPGGVLIIAFPPFYSIKGGHIGFPFIHWLPDSICKFAAKLIGKQRQFETYLGLNRITIAQFHVLCSEIGMEISHEHDLLFGTKLPRIPLAREGLATTYVAVLCNPLE
jgi:ubiquinone/menaquinone biosynthesis C-methylase UbiE